MSAGFSKDFAQLHFTNFYFCFVYSINFFLFLFFIVDCSVVSRHQQIEKSAHWPAYSGLVSLRILWPRNDAWILVAALFSSGSVRSMSSSSATFLVISCMSSSSGTSLFTSLRAKWPRKVDWIFSAAWHNSATWKSWEQRRDFLLVFIVLAASGHLANASK